MPTTLHLIRASHLNAVIQNIRALPVPVESLLEKAGLHAIASIEPNQLVIEKKIWVFLKLVADFTSMPHLATWLTEKSDLSQYGEFTKHLLNAENLHQALLLLTQQSRHHNSNNAFVLKEDLNNIWICHPHLRHVKEGAWQVEQHLMSFMCMLIEHYLGEGWRPKKIKLKDMQAVGIEQSRFFKATDIKLGQAYSAIAIDRRLLKDRSSVFDLPSLAEIDYIPNSFLQAFKLLLKQGYFGQDWLAENIAASLDISVRTLKRKLHVEGSSLRQVFDEIRFQQACELIEQNIHEYEILAEKLSYTHPNNFVRAFKRWSGLTPREYIRLRYRDLS